MGEDNDGNLYKQRIIWEESPHDVIEENLTMFFTDILEEMDSLGLSYSNSFEERLEGMAEKFREEREEADETSISEWELARRKDRCPRQDEEAGQRDRDNREVRIHSRTGEGVVSRSGGVREIYRLFPREVNLRDRRGDS